MHRLQTLYTIRIFNSLHFDVLLGFLNERLIFFLEEPSDLHIAICTYGGERVKQASFFKRLYYSHEANSTHLDACIVVL